MYVVLIIFFLLRVFNLVHQVKLEENEECCLGAYIHIYILFQLKFILFQVTIFCMVLTLVLFNYNHIPAI